MTTRRKSNRAEIVSSAAKKQKFQSIELIDYDSDVEIKEEPPAMFNFVDVNNYTECTEAETSTSSQTKTNSPEKRPIIQIPEIVVPLSSAKPTQKSAQQNIPEIVVPLSSLKPMPNPVLPKVVTPIKTTEVKANKPIRIILNKNILIMPSAPTPGPGTPQPAQITVSASNKPESQKVPKLTRIADINEVPPLVYTKYSSPSATRTSSPAVNTQISISRNDFSFQNYQTNNKSVNEQIQTLERKLDHYDKQTERRFAILHILMNKIINQNQILLEKNKDNNMLDMGVDLDELLDNVEEYSPKPEEESLFSEILNKPTNQEELVINTSGKYAEKLKHCMKRLEKSQGADTTRGIYQKKITNIAELVQLNEDLEDPKNQDEYEIFLSGKVRDSSNLVERFTEIATDEVMCEYSLLDPNKRQLSDLKNWLKCFQQTYDTSLKNVLKLVGAAISASTMRLIKKKLVVPPAKEKKKKSP